MAKKTGTELQYTHQDHLTSTSLMTDNSGNKIGTIVKYLPFGVCRNNPPNVPIDKLFTGQRLDGTGLYFYNARYYDPTIGRFISADTVIQSMANPQCLNRYSYCINNPLKYTDPSGQKVNINGWDVEVINTMMKSGYYLPIEAQQALNEVTSSTEYRAYNDMKNNNKSYTSYLETSKQVFCITSNGSPSKTDLKHVEEGATLLKLTSSGTGVDVRRYTPDGCWNFLTGGWTRETKRPPIASWNEIGDKLSSGWDNIAHTDWSKVGDALQITAGTLGVEFFGGAAALGIVSPLTGSAAGLSWSWMAKGWYNISDGKIHLDPMDSLYIPW